MKRKFILLLSIFTFVALWGANVTAATAEFSADLSMTLSNGQAMKGKVYLKQNKIRNEILIMGMQNVTIARQDKRVTWILYPAKKQYREAPMKYDPAHPTPDMPFETKDIGTGRANGYDCKLVQYTFKNPEYGIVVNWIATQLNVPVRVEVKNKANALIITIDYSNIKLGPQPDSLFEIPAGYTKMDK